MISTSQSSKRARVDQRAPAASSSSKKAIVLPTALESLIFSFLRSAEMQAIAAVNRSWRACGARFAVVECSHLTTYCEQFAGHLPSKHFMAEIAKILGIVKRKNFCRPALDRIERMGLVDNEIYKVVDFQNWGDKHHSIVENKPLALLALRINGRLLDRFSPVLQDDLELVKTSVTQDPSFIGDLKHKHKTNLDVIKAAVLKNADALFFVLKFIRIDLALAKQFAALNGLTLLSMAQYNNDMEVSLAAVQQNGLAYLFIDKGLQHNRKILKAAIANSPGIITQAPEYLQDDPEIIAAYNEAHKNLAKREGLETYKET